MKQTYRVVGGMPINVTSGWFPVGAEHVSLTDAEALHLQRTGAVELEEAAPASAVDDVSGLAETPTPAPIARKK